MIEKRLARVIGRSVRPDVGDGGTSGGRSRGISRGGSGGGSQTGLDGGAGFLHPAEMRESRGKKEMRDGRTARASPSTLRRVRLLVAETELSDVAVQVAHSTSAPKHVRHCHRFPPASARRGNAAPIDRGGDLAEQRRARRLGLLE